MSFAAMNRERKDTNDDGPERGDDLGGRGVAEHEYVQSCIMKTSCIMA